MATVLATDLRTLLIDLRERIMDRLDFPAERVLIIARAKMPANLQADQYVIIRVMGQKPDWNTEYGHGRVEHRVRRTLQIVLKTRLATDEVNEDFLWLTDKSLGHLDMEHELYDSLQTYSPIDVNDNALIYEPLVVTMVDRPLKEEVNEEWGESWIEVELPFIMRLDQTYQ